MVKKIDKSAGPSAQADTQHASALAGSVKQSAQQIWLAGMGAFSKAQEEGTKVFEALVKEGLTLQKKTQGLAEEKLGEVSDKLSAMADTVSARTGQNWDKLEAIFEQRTAKALGKLGVPTARDVAALSERVDALAAALDRLGKGAARPATQATPGATATPRTARKAPAAKAGSAAVAAPVVAPPAARVSAKAPGKAPVKPAVKPAAQRSRKPAAKPVA
jgi:poly(hydroxyalkanoate) granule-associated protein